MKKLFLLLILFSGTIFYSQANTSSYSLNEKAVDQLFDNATESFMLDITSTMNNSSASFSANSKDPLVAILLNFFLGEFGIHRFYLGTELISGLAYPLTCAGFFGIVPLIDIIILAVNYDDISAFVDNPNFFMWKDEF